MKVKAGYFRDAVKPALKSEIDQACKPFESSFREELFDKLYDFFSRYFSESGSIYFRNTRADQGIYERVYTDDRDVMLFWKTHMLYYVKTDRLFKSLQVTVDGEIFYFDASAIENKRANEKREVIYAFKERETPGRFVFTVGYAESGRKTKREDILAAIAKTGVTVDEETLEKAFRTFEKQAEVDYFINKDAKAFLCEQFDLWFYQNRIRDFHPDFVFWFVRGQDYPILFLDPKGQSQTQYQYKVDGYREHLRADGGYRTFTCPNPSNYGKHTVLVALQFYSNTPTRPPGLVEAYWCRSIEQMLKRLSG